MLEQKAAAKFEFLFFGVLFGARRRVLGLLRLLRISQHLHYLFAIKHNFLTHLHDLLHHLSLLILQLRQIWIFRVIF